MVRAGLGAALSLLVVVACGGDDASDVDAGPGDGDGGVGDVDAGDGVSALELDWRLVPSVDAEPTGSLALVITTARFGLEDVRAVGDAQVLERESFELEFGGERGTTLRFAPAAPGLYSSLAGGFDQYTLRGTIELDGERWEFEIRDEPPPWMSFSIPLDAEVLPGRTERVELRIDAGDVLAAIDWSQVEVDDGELQIERESDEIDDVREALADAFRLD